MRPILWTILLRGAHPVPEALVRQFMSSPVLTVAPHLPLGEVASRMSEARVPCAVVCTASGEPLGLVTERDMTRAYARDAGKHAAMTACTAMSQGVSRLSADARCSDALQVMRERGVRCLIVTDGECLAAGVITHGDLLRARADAIEDRRRSLEQQVAERTRALIAVNTRLEALTRVDPLLGIGNRRAMDEEMERLEVRARRYRCAYSVALLDVDYFKRFNDHYGHCAGDAVLRQVAQAVAGDVRAADAVFRYGGEEFLIALPEVDEGGAAVAAEHVRRTVAALAIAHGHSPFGHVSVSVGVASGAIEDPCWTRVVARADEALYEAKRAGRNRIGRAGALRRAA
jgi:diguanylate cyclase (GGDEF)-like protein